MRALSKDPDQRYATADAFGRELQQIRKSLHPSVSTAQLDETRFASTMVMKALHQDLQQTQAGAKPATRGGTLRHRATQPAEMADPRRCRRTRARGRRGICRDVERDLTGWCESVADDRSEFGFGRNPGRNTAANDDGRDGAACHQRQRRHQRPRTFRRQSPRHPRQ